jgi:SAM-dependent methyltransferase
MLGGKGVVIMGSAQVQGELWGTDPRNWAAYAEPLMAPMHEAAIQALGPLDGRLFLDAGCGTGYALSLAAAAGARVSGLDAAAPMLDVARERVPDADLRVGDIEALPYDDATFDVTTAFNAIQYAADPKNAVVELVRVTRPGGRVVIGVWGAPDQCETEAVFAAVRAVAPPPPGTPAPLAVAAPGMVEQLLGTAGLTVNGRAEVDCPFTYPDVETAWRGHGAGGPFRRAAQIAGEDAVREAFFAAHAGSRQVDGGYRQDNVFRYVIGEKPAG